MLSMRHLFGGLSDFSGHQTLSPQGDDDKLVGNSDIWLCHNCGDCSTRCPREAKPGDVLAAVRSYTISEYAQPKALAKALKDPKKLPILLAVPAVLFLVIGLITGLLDFTPDTSQGIKHYKFISTWLVDMIMVPSAIFMVAVFALSLKRFLGDIHQNALAEGKTNKEKIEPVGFLMSLVKIIPTVLKHNKFSDCTENKEREIAHLPSGVMDTALTGLVCPLRIFRFSPV